MNDKRIGHWIEATGANGKYEAYIPAPLPPEPPINFLPLFKLVEEAGLALGRIDIATSILPDPNLFIFMYVRKEALLSSQIEGTQSSLSDLLLFEANETPTVPIDDVEEVSNYIVALNHGLEEMKTRLPLSLRLLRSTHRILLQGGRGTNAHPGEFRRIQNWIGGTMAQRATYVPPPVNHLEQCLDNLEKFFHDDSGIPVLIKAAIAHVQFESIHPFLDGNGRLGRLLITLMLCSENILKEPTLYLSLYFKTHRSIYYEKLQRVRTHGEWEEWLTFFLDGVIETANQAAETAQKVLQLFEEDSAKIQTLGRATGSASNLHQLLQKRALITVPKAASELASSETTIHTACRNLEKLGIVKEITGKPRHKVYIYADYFQLIEQGTEPQ